MKKHPIAILVLTAAFLLSACAGEPAGQQAGADLKPAAAPQAAAAAAAVAGQPAAAKPGVAKPPDGKVADRFLGPVTAKDIEAAIAKAGGPDAAHVPAAKS